MGRARYCGEPAGDGRNMSGDACVVAGSTRPKPGDAGPAGTVTVGRAIVWEFSIPWKMREGLAGTARRRILERVRDAPCRRRTVDRSRNTGDSLLRGATHGQRTRHPVGGSPHRGRAARVRQGIRAPRSRPTGDEAANRLLDQQLPQATARRAAAPPTGGMAGPHSSQRSHARTGQGGPVAHAGVRRLPARSPLNSPSSTTIRPLTMTVRMPPARRSGAS